MQSLIPFFGLYLILINLLEFLLFAYDKIAARKKHSRVPEIQLWRLAFFGAAFGAWLAMELFRHKTKHRKFVQIIPWLALIQGSILLYIWRRFTL